MSETVPLRTATVRPTFARDWVRPGGEASAGRPSRVVDSQPIAEIRSVLVVEDDPVTQAFLIDNLIADGFRAAGASGVGEGLRAIEVRRPALVVLDLGLPDGSGLALLDRVRTADGLASRIDPDVPVIVLSGRTGDADRVRSFARGADDHLSKPFLYAELVARMRAVLRRADGRRSRGVMRVGELTLDPATRAVRLAGRRIELAAKEFALLQALAEQPMRVYGKQELLRDVWGRGLTGGRDCPVVSTGLLRDVWGGYRGRPNPDAVVSQPALMPR